MRKGDKWGSTHKQCLGLKGNHPVQLFRGLCQSKLLSTYIRWQKLRAYTHTHTYRGMYTHAKNNLSCQKSIAKHISASSYSTLISQHISADVPQLHKDTSGSTHRFRNPEAPTYTDGKSWDNFSSCSNKITTISHRHIETPFSDKWSNKYTLLHCFSICDVFGLAL